MSRPLNHYPALVVLLLAVIVGLVMTLVLSKSSDYRASDSQVAGEQQVFHWRMVTMWPKNFPGLGSAPERFADNVARMSDGRLQIKVHGAGEIVPALGVFDAVSLGNVEMGHGASYYWGGKLKGAAFFTTVPFGLTAQEQNGWLYFGGGIELWREAYEPYNLVPLAGGNSGLQMAGWFNREINSIEDLQGLKMRMPGIAGTVLGRLGGTPVTLPGGEIYTALQTGVIDATEWVGPYNDQAFGLYEAAKYYYYPGWHEPGSTLEMIVNKQALESLPADLQAIVEVAARAANQDMLDEYTARNTDALQSLIENHGVQMKRLPDDVLLSLRETSDQVVREMVAGDELAERIYHSWRDYRDKAVVYQRIAEQAFVVARDLPEKDD
jgi:TRAP-type mannitol/chloroaromatic compound transport system substrate-binding protein